MHSLTRLLVVTLAVSACLASLGCKGRSWGGGGHSAGGVKEGVKFDYTIEHLTCDGRVYLVLAADGCSGGGSGSGPTAQGQLYAPDGRKIAWSCTTQDGTSGTVTIDGQHFDLAKGAVFLVSAKENKTRVEQLAVDMSKLQGGPVQDKLPALADTEPRIAAFCKGAPGEK
jgi:hypothetical protein